MSKNMTNLIFNEVSRLNRNTYKASINVLKEEDEYIEETKGQVEEVPYDNTTEKFCPRCGRTYTDFPAWSRYDNETLICPDCGVEEAMINFTGGKLSNPNIVKKPDVQTEEVTIENPSNEDLERDDAKTNSAKKKELEDRIGELRQVLHDGGLAEDEKKAIEDEIDELEDMLNESAKVLTEAPEDEVPEEDLPIEDVPEEPTEEMSDDEYEEEIQDDKEDTIEDAVEEPFYATTSEFDELRDVLVDLDYRLFLINDNMVCIGRLNGPDIEFLTSNRPEDTETEVSEQNDKAEEIETKASEDGEQAFEYKWIKAPDTFDKFVNQVNVVYLSPEMSDEDKEQYAGIEASHDSVMNFLMNELPEDKKEEHENEEAKEELEDIEEVPTEEPEEISDEEFEVVDEELPKEDEEEEEE